MKNDNRAVTPEQAEKYSEAFHANKAYVIASRAVVNNGLMESAKDYEVAGRLSPHFSIDLKQGKITNQKQSGRCWLFAALNTFRYEIMQKLKLNDFELSQSYLFFYDKLEKANMYLENMLAIKDEPVGSRLYDFLNADPLQDGGQWDMLANLVKKYGVIPKDIYPEAKSAESSRWMKESLTSKLREFAVTLRKAALEGKKSEAQLRKMKLSMLEEVYRILAICLGEPPKVFDFTVRDKDDKVTQDFNITPVQFFEKYVGIDLDSRVSLINAPAENKPMNRMYTVKFLGNVAEGGRVEYLNLEIETIKDAVIKQLKNGHPVWFGSDCAKFGLRKAGIFDRNSMNIEELFDINYEFTKGERLIYGDSAMNHAMVILGVNLDENGAPDKWRIENSWGKDSGMEGYYVASDAWFDEFVYQVVVDKKYLTKKTLKLFEQEPIELEPWDPLGTLAD
ncbi:MAG: C1 family peptidase [Lachnospiraceae bacterium]|nr:C1 family peptidase [Lachnospiraceae bacterium]